MKFETEENMMIEIVFVISWEKRLRSRREQKSRDSKTKSRDSDVNVSPVVVLIESCDLETIDD